MPNVGEIVSFHVQGNPKNLVTKLCQQSVNFKSLSKYYIKVVSVGFYVKTQLGHKVNDTKLVTVHEVTQEPVTDSKRRRTATPFFDVNSFLILCCSGVLGTYRQGFKEVTRPSPLAQVHFSLSNLDTHYFTKIDSPWLLLNNLSEGYIKFFYQNSLNDDEALTLLTDIELSVHYLIGKDANC